jgi:8-oxo-dGTP pyrophosphatase MutT (NUDIX family)
MVKNSKMAPIVSYGIIAYICDKTNKHPINLQTEKMLEDCVQFYKPKNSSIKLLMIQRRDTMGYIDFVRGKYDINKLPILFSEMTCHEHEMLMSHNFDYLWDNLWMNHNSKYYKNEYHYAKRKYGTINIKYYIKEYPAKFKYTEWGFPKGRKNMNESNTDCAAREFEEETGYDRRILNVKYNNYLVEEFRGTNGIMYKHIYYIVKVSTDIPIASIKTDIQREEVKNIAWMDYYSCISLLRDYDIEKKKVIRMARQKICYIENNIDYKCDECIPST